jgi:short-subunit dehydrogenase
MKTALITGASAGIGWDLAQLFVKDGYSVVLVARRKDLLEKLSVELKTLDAKAQIFVIEEDLAVPGAGRILFEKLKTQKIEIEFLVNNAGFGLAGVLGELSVEKQLQMIDLNVRTLAELTYLILPEMLKRGSGRILNVGSVAGFVPGPFMATYYATKAFVNSFSEALHEELHGKGVSVTVLTPGATATEFAKVSGSDKASLFKRQALATSKEVAEAGYRGMMRGEAIALPGFSNKALVQLLRILPRFAIRKITAKLNRLN